MAGKAFMLAAVQGFCRTVIEHEGELNRLDNAIGDGDHGTNMARGCRKVLVALPDMDATREDLGDILHHVGMIFISEVGGSAGPLFGTFFLRAGMACHGKTAMEPLDWVRSFEAGAAGVSRLGMSSEGDKTMLDALFPAGRAMQGRAEAGAPLQDIFAAGADAAEAGVEHTKAIQASKGRAAYIGERSIGHQDPGATTIMLMLRALHRTSAEADGG